MKLEFNNGLRANLLRVCLLALVLINCLHANDEDPQATLSKIFCVEGEQLVLKKFESISVVHSTAIDSENYIYVSFEAERYAFSKYLSKSRIKNNGVIEKPDHTLYGTFKNDLPVFPLWFKRTNKKADICFECDWQPSIQEGKEKSEFGVVCIHFDAYRLADGSFQFYGVISTGYWGLTALGNSQKLVVKKSDFSKGTYLGLSPE